jgi:ribokinase
MTACPSVLVVGSINVDIVVHADRLPAAGETVGGGRLERSGGGKGANQAVAAARAGAAVALVGAVGDDDFGAESLDALRAEGVDVSAVRRIEGVATGVALIVVDSAGDNQIAVASGANHELTAAHVRPAGERGEPAGKAGPRARVEPAAHDRVANPRCVLASFELRDGAVLAAAQLARDAGCPLVVNPAPARPLAAALCELQPILTPNRTEAAQLSGDDDPQAAARALGARTGAPVIVTLGERGALVSDAAGTLLVPAPAVRAVDTTGAGDSFNGALAAELARGANLRAAVTAAVQAAARSVTRPGARG